MKTIAILNSKGGVGKTTKAVTLAAGLAGMGCKVVLVDTDPQGNVAKWFGMPEESGIYDLLIKERPVDELLRQVPMAQWWPGETSGVLAIHAGKTDGDIDLNTVLDQTERAKLPADMPHGAVVCLAQLVDVLRVEEISADPEFALSRESRLGNFAPGRYGWHLEVIRVFDPPIPARGAQGLWDWPVPVDEPPPSEFPVPENAPPPSEYESPLENLGAYMEFVPGPEITRPTILGGPQKYRTLRLAVRRGLTDDEVRLILRERLEKRAGLFTGEVIFE